MKVGLGGESRNFVLLLNNINFSEPKCVLDNGATITKTKNSVG